LLLLWCAFVISGGANRYHSSRNAHEITRLHRHRGRRSAHVHTGRRTERECRFGCHLPPCRLAVAGDCWRRLAVIYVLYHTWILRDCTRAAMKTWTVNGQDPWRTTESADCSRDSQAIGSGTTRTARRHQPPGGGGLEVFRIIIMIIIYCYSCYTYFCLSPLSCTLHPTTSVILL